MLEQQEPKPKGIAAWEYTLRASTESPVYGGIIIDRFARCLKESPVTLFVPWGASPTRTTANNYDQTALNRIEQFSRILAMCDVPNDVLIMPADVYAIEINGDDLNRVAQYFSSVRSKAERFGFSVIPWSTIREQNWDLYENTVRWECSPEVLWRSTPKALWYDGLLPAALSRNAGRGENAIRQSAFRYLQERIAEARIIEAAYAPVKLSMVSKQKDDIVDRELPRVYILDKNWRFPWLKGA